MINNIYLFLSPSESAFSYPESMPRLSLNLGQGVICGYLEGNGVEVGMSDLNVALSEYVHENGKKHLEKIYDYDRFKQFMETGNDIEMEELIDSIINHSDFEKYDCFGISIGADFSFLQINFGFLLAQYLKNKYNKPIFIGGNNISFLFIFKDVFEDLWRIVLKEDFYIIKGAGERAIYEIIRKSNSGYGKNSIFQINGIVKFEENEIMSNPEFEPLVIRPRWTNLDMNHYMRCMKVDSNTNEISNENLIYYFKWPDTYDGSPGQLVNRYIATFNKNDYQHKLIIPYIFNYNCPFNCAFCTQSDFDRGGIIGGEVDKVLSDIEFLKEEYNTNYFYFLNNAFNYSAKFVDEFCRRAIEKNLNIFWSDCGRFNNLTYERLKLMKNAGCTKLTFGFESGSPKIIKLIDKQIDLNHARQVLIWCSDLGIWADIEIIIGLPQENEADFQDTCNFLIENSKYINYFWVNEFFVIPNSLIGRYPRKYGIDLIKNMTNYHTLLRQNYDYFKGKSNNIMTSNSRLYGFNEINGRTYKEILQSDRNKISRINKLQSKEFPQASKFYSFLLNK